MGTIAAMSVYFLCGTCDNGHSFCVDFCPELEVPSYGDINYSKGQAINSVATYRCDDGYNLIGSEKRTCQANGTWSGEDPFCESK